MSRAEGSLNEISWCVPFALDELQSLAACTVLTSQPMGLPIRLLALCSRPEELVAQVAAALPANAKYAVFDAVTSNTAIVLPIPELVELCHSRQGAVRLAAPERRWAPAMFVVVREHVSCGACTSFQSAQVRDLWTLSHHWHCPTAAGEWRC